MIYITSAGTYTIGKAFGVRLNINQTTTGTVTIKDGSTTVGVLAIGATSAMKDYWGFTGSISIVTSATEDITVNILNRQP